MQKSPEIDTSSADKKRSFKETAKNILFYAGVGVAVLLGAAGIVVTEQEARKTDDMIREKIKERHLQDERQSECLHDEAGKTCVYQNAYEWQTPTETTEKTAVKSKMSLEF